MRLLDEELGDWYTALGKSHINIAQLICKKDPKRFKIMNRKEATDDEKKNKDTIMDLYDKIKK